jgi:ribosome maturation factor RimP
LFVARPGKVTGVLALAGIVESTLAGMGYELVDAQLSNRGRLIRIFLDRPGGVTLDECADVSRHLTRVFAVEGIEYDRLEVSSPGLDRPLRKAADFARFAGRKAEVRMRAPDAGGRRRFVGLLCGVEGGVVTLEVDGQRVALPLEQMDRARLVPDL